MKAVPELFRLNRQGMTQHGRLSPHIGGICRLSSLAPKNNLHYLASWVRGLPSCLKLDQLGRLRNEIVGAKLTFPRFWQYPNMDMSQSPWKPMRWTSAKVAKPEKWLDQYILFWQWFPAIFLTHQPRNHYTLKVETLRWPGRISGRIRSEWTKTKKYAGWWFGTLEKWGY